MTDLPSGVTTLSYTGADVDYTVPEDGYIDIKLWGAGGGGGAKAAASQFPGGGGGMARATGVRVTAGQVIKLQVGGGGGVPTVTTLVGGAGGWPDGGDGSAGSTGLTTAGLAGGGGSSRLWIDSVIHAVAGGGGGSAGFTTGGGGGGKWGQNGAGTYAINTGAFQTAGGFSSTLPSDTNLTGIALSTTTNRTGAHGYSTAYTDRTTKNDYGGGGGGGGYYGGGGGATSTATTRQYNAGGGGSSYVKSNLFGYLKPAAGSVPPSDADLAGSRANGGVGAAYGACTPGQSGYIYLKFTPDSAIDDAPTSKTVISATEEASYYIAPQDGSVTIKSWGAGGGGGGNTDSTTNGNGAGGGFTAITVSVFTGDIIKLLPGTGGFGAICGASHAGGKGGFPRGEYGGTYTTAANYWTGGGGGGASRAWINETLCTVAGAGGGGRGKGNTASSLIRAGAGGGTSGGDGYGGTTAISRVSGATQSSGGLNTTLSAENGSLGQAGPGYTSTALNPFSVISTNSGGGGGDGYYGGGGGGNSGITSGGGGSGGSSYLLSGAGVIASSTEAGVFTQGATAPGGLSDPDRSLVTSTLGYGGLATTSTSGTGVTGGNGVIVFIFEVAGASAEADGTIGTVSMSIPSGSATVSVNKSVSIGTITMTAPTGSTPIALTLPMPGPITMTAPTGIGQVLAGASGSIGTVTMTAPNADAAALIGVYPDLPDPIDVLSLLEASPESEAIVILDLEDALHTDGFTPPEATATGEGYAEAEIATIQMTSPEGVASAGLSITASVEAVVSMTAPEGYAEYVEDAFGDLAMITLTTPEGGAVGSAEAVNELQIVFTSSVNGYVNSGNISLFFDLPGPIGVFPFDALVETAQVDASGALGTITVSPFSAEAIPNAVIGSIPTITMTPLSAATTGDKFITIPLPGPVAMTAPTALASGLTVDAGGPIGTVTLATPIADATGRGTTSGPVGFVQMTGVEGEATGQGFKAATFDLTITFAIPIPVTQKAISLSAPIKTVFMRPMTGYAGEIPWLEGFALGEPTPDIIMVSPEADPTGDTGVEFFVTDMPTVTMIAAEGYAEYVVEAFGDLATITLTVLESSTAWPKTLADVIFWPEVQTNVLFLPFEDRDFTHEVEVDQDVRFIGLEFCDVIVETVVSTDFIVRS